MTFDPVPLPPEQNEDTSSMNWRKWYYDIYYTFSGSDERLRQNLMQVITKADKSIYGKVLTKTPAGIVQYEENIYYNTSCLQVGLTAVVVVPTATATVIPHDVVDIDQDSTYNTANGRWIPKKKGKYWVVANVTWPLATMVANSQISSAIYKNGATLMIGAAFDTGGSAQGKSAIVTGIINVTDLTDYYEHYCYHTMGANKSPDQQTSLTYFHAFRFGD